MANMALQHQKSGTSLANTHCVSWKVFQQYQVNQILV